LNLEIYVCYEGVSYTEKKGAQREMLLLKCCSFTAQDVASNIESDVSLKMT